MMSRRSTGPGQYRTPTTRGTYGRHDMPHGLSDVSMQTGPFGVIMLLAGDK